MDAIRAGVEVVPDPVERVGFETSKDEIDEFFWTHVTSQIIICLLPPHCEDDENGGNPPSSMKKSDGYASWKEDDGLPFERSSRNWLHISRL